MLYFFIFLGDVKGQVVAIVFRKNLVEGKEVDSRFFLFVKIYSFDISWDGQRLMRVPEFVSLSIISMLSNEYISMVVMV